jgi:hypothetical protein
LLREMQVVLEDIDRAGPLSAPQYRKLAVAAKGAIDRYLSDSNVDAASAAKTPPDRGDGNALLFAPVVVPAKPAGVQIQRLPDGVIVVDAARNELRATEMRLIGPTTVEVADVLKQGIWQAALQKTLNATQRAAYDQAQRARAEYRQSKDADPLLVLIDGRLLLSPQQRQQLAPLLSDGLSRLPAAVRRAAPERTLAMLARQIPATKLRPMLSEAQLALWTELASSRTASSAVSREVNLVIQREFELRQQATGNRQLGRVITREQLEALERSKRLEAQVRERALRAREEIPKAATDKQQP